MLASLLVSCLLSLALANPVPGSPPHYNAAFDNGSYGYYPVRSYTTDDLISPRTNFRQWDPRCDDGRMYFISPRGWSLSLPGPMILDSRGDLVWSHHYENEFGGQAYNFMVQEYKGENYLTFWLGDDRVRGHGSGSYYMLNASYDVVHRVSAANGLTADLHEFLITPEGTALMTMYEIVPYDVTTLREFAPNEEDPNYIWDCLFQEIRIGTGELLFEWRASEHVDVTETYHNIGEGGTKSDPFDWFHINSVEKDALGNYLISARYTHNVMYIDGRDGHLIWQLGGKNNYFMDMSNGYGLNFAWQHHAQFVSPQIFPNMYTPPAKEPGVTTQLLSLFDNAAEDNNYEYGLTYSRGLLLELTYPDDANYTALEDLAQQSSSQIKGNYSDPELNIAKILAINGSDPNYQVRVIQSYENPERVRSSSQGSMQLIPRDGQDAQVLVGFGLNAVWTEFQADGNVLCDAHFAAATSWERGDVSSYRVYKFIWKGKPQTKPRMEISDDEAEVYVSWNGATDVAEWVLQSADAAPTSERSWADVARKHRQGFETTISIPRGGVSRARFLRMIALGRQGQRLNYGSSEIIDRKSSPTEVMGQLHARIEPLGPVRMLFLLVAMSGGIIVVWSLFSICCDLR
ncbi:hypothetical protein K470DRAFT_253934 [Piedraia hortae CBS 480.64]|uniref:ASST-domain-containing protein n=1 Tax=Piedraia hortae CBS 480.64 TaxID=1314780 RepID=A0A6A7CCX7_9PEZI|nr:hypothetical protein K470DRAFT_253934 [Piedraia hortae CBS 480.64]